MSIEAPTTVRAGDLTPALTALESLYQRALKNVHQRVSKDGRVSASLLNKHQLAAHGLAYLATELEAARQIVAWAERVASAGDAELEQSIAGAYVGELCRHLVGGIELGPCESIALTELGLEEADVAATLLSPKVQAVAERYASGEALCRLARVAVEKRSFGNWALDDETLEAIQTEFRRFVSQEV